MFRSTVYPAGFLRTPSLFALSLPTRTSLSYLTAGASADDLATLHRICLGHGETAENPCRCRRPYIFLIPQCQPLRNQKNWPPAQWQMSESVHGQAVTHRSTGCAQRCLTLVIADAVLRPHIYYCRSIFLLFINKAAWKLKELKEIFSQFLGWYIYKSSTIITLKFCNLEYDIMEKKIMGIWYFWVILNTTVILFLLNASNLLTFWGN